MGGGLFKRPGAGVTADVVDDDEVCLAKFWDLLKWKYSENEKKKSVKSHKVKNNLPVIFVMNIVGDFLQILHVCNQHGSQFDKITMCWIFNFNYISTKNYNT